MLLGDKLQSHWCFCARPSQSPLPVLGHRLTDLWKPENFILSKKINSQLLALPFVCHADWACMLMSVIFYNEAAGECNDGRRRPSLAAPPPTAGYIDILGVNVCVNTCNFEFALHRQPDGCTSVFVEQHMPAKE